MNTRLLSLLITFALWVIAFVVSSYITASEQFTFNWQMIKEIQLFVKTPVLYFALFSFFGKFNKGRYKDVALVTLIVFFLRIIDFFYIKEISLLVYDSMWIALGGLFTLGLSYLFCKNWEVQKK